MKIVGISDVSVGYGSPEVPALMDSICRLYGARGLLIEPDEIARPPVTLEWAAFDIKRFHTDFTDHSRAWHATFRKQAMRMVDQQRPDILVLFGSAVFPALLLARRRIGKVVYHAYEFISQLSPADIAAHKLLLGDVDLMIAPEVERLIIDLETIGGRPRATAPVYNVADVAYPSPVKTSPAGERNGRFIYFGTFHRRQSLAGYFWEPLLSEHHFDLFGRITDPQRDEVEAAFLSAPNIRYHGVVDAADLNRERCKANFSLVWWNPDFGPGYYYVPPNRFFTSIQAHVPPIAAPHPQCVAVIKRYGCGLLMKDWSLPSLKQALDEARSLIGTAKYDRMIAGCKHAVEAEFEWSKQFKRLEPHFAAMRKPDDRVFSQVLAPNRSDGTRHIH